MAKQIDVMAVLADYSAQHGDPEDFEQARAAVAELIEADQEAIDTLDSLIHAMALPMPDALHMKALRAALPRLLEAKRSALARFRGEA